MDQLSARLLNHPVTQRIEQLRAQLSSIEEERRQQADAADVGWILERLEAVLDRLDGVIQTTVPELVATPTLDNIVASLGQIEAELSNFRTNANPGHLTNLNSYLDQVVTHAAQLPAILLADPKRARAISNQFGKALRDQAADLDSRIQALRKEAEQAQSSLQARRAEWEQKQANEQATAHQRLEDLRVQIESEKQRTDALVQQETARLVQLRTDHQTELEQLVKQQNDNAAEVAQQLTAEAEQLQKRLETEADAALAEVVRKQEQVNELYRVIADTGTSGAFRNEAKVQKEQADLWRWVAVIIAALTAAGGVILLLTAGHDPGTGEVAGKTLGTLAGFGIAAYAGGQSALHRRRERDAKRLELEIAALGPFVEDMEAETAQAVRVTVADRMFRGAEHGMVGEKEDAATGPSLLPQLIQLLRSTAG